MRTSRGAPASAPPPSPPPSAAPSPAPSPDPGPDLLPDTEVLIPEARRHQRRRYRRRGVAAVVGVLVAAVLIVSAALLFRGPTASGHGQRRPTPAAASGAATATGVVYFRPVLCFAPAYTPPAGSVPPRGGAPTARGTGPLPACASSSALTAANLGVTPERGQGKGEPDGFRSNNVPLDQQFASDPSTSPHAPGYASRTVLLPGVAGACDQIGGTRCVLGPAELSSRDVARAAVQHARDGQWLVNFAMTPSGSPLWDEVADESFHQMLGIELDGVVYSAPIIQPVQSSFSSFEGHGTISGGLTHADAVRLARQLNSPTPDREVSPPPPPRSRRTPRRWGPGPPGAGDV